MAAAVIVSVALGIWVGAAYIRNKVAWDSARTAKGRLDAAKKRRWSSALGMLWPIGASLPAHSFYRRGGKPPVLALR